MRIGRLAVLFFFVGCVLFSFTCSSGPSDSVAESFVRDFAKSAGEEVVEFEVIERGAYEQIYEYWAFTAKARMRDSEGRISALVFKLAVGRDDKGSAWVLKGFDVQPIPSWRLDE